MKAYPRHMYQIVAKHMCAGFVTLPSSEGDKVAWCAPILNYMVGWTMPEVEAYCKRKKWELRKGICHGHKA